MFSATITGQIQRVIHDNGKSGKDAMVKVVLAVTKQYFTDAAESKIFPLITIWGHDAAYLRKYAGKGQMITIINAEADYFKNDKRLDEDGNPIEQVSFKAGKVAFPKADIMKALVEAGVAEEAEGGDEDEDDDRSSRRKKSSTGRKKSSTRDTGRKSRGRRDEDEDEDDDEDEEEEEPRRRSSRKSSTASKTKSKSTRRRRDEEEDEEDDDDYFDED